MKVSTFFLSLFFTVSLAACSVSATPSPLPSPTLSPARLGEPFQVHGGESRLILPDMVSLQFVAVVQDSRCPSDVTCIRAGEAVVLVRLSAPDHVAGQATLTLPPGAAGSDRASIDAYLVAFTAIAPLQVSARTIEPSQYVATFVVIRP